MKKIAALALAALALFAGPAKAEPSQRATSYYIFAPDLKPLLYIPASFERKGNVVQSWLAISVPADRIVIYTLVSHDCAGKTSTLLRNESRDYFTGRLIARDPQNKAVQPKPNTNLYEARQIACYGKATIPVMSSSLAAKVFREHYKRVWDHIA